MGDYKKLGIVGAGNMGSMMTQLFAEAGLEVSVFDVKAENVDIATKLASENPKTKHHVRGFKDYESFMHSLGDPGGRLLLFSITHGSPADTVLGEIGRYLKEGDIILDGGNEWYLNSERRMKELEKKGVSYIGMGVSGGYQSARHGPSMSPGGDPTALDKVMPLLEKVAAKDSDGQPCVRKIGPAGAGHYVKMVHNGIEQGMLSALCEAWGIMRFKLGLELDEIGEIFTEWNCQGELKDNFLVEIGADICKRRHPDDNSKHVLDEVMDKVVQDADDTEGTGVWSVMEAARNHISAPTITAGHFFRIASADRKQRVQVAQHLKLPLSQHSDESIGIAMAYGKAHANGNGNGHENGVAGKKSYIIEDLRLAVYASFLASFVQGLALIAKQSNTHEWNVSLKDCIKIWRAGCIISSAHIANLILPIVQNKPTNKPPSTIQIPHSEILTNLLLHPTIAHEFARIFPHLQRIVSGATSMDSNGSVLMSGANVPSMSATLEWVKYCAGEKLPTMFMEAELDYFGAHSYDKWGEGDGVGEVKKGKYHFEWKPA